MKKNRHRYHPPTAAEIREAESRLSKSDQRIIRAGIRAATGEVKGDITGTTEFKVASAVLSNPPASLQDTITVVRSVGDKVVGSDYQSHIIFDLFGGDMIEATKAFEEFIKVMWYLDEVADADILHRNEMGESMLKNLPPDAKVIVKDWIGRYFDDDRAEYVIGVIGVDNLSHQPNDEVQ